ncbi:MAG: hypothetical protein ABW091_10565 [Microbacterium sp.]
MRALVVYESMFGATRTIAEAMVAALEHRGLIVTLSTAASAPCSTAGFGLVVVGAPTHAHTLPQASSRTEAAEWAANPAKALTLEPSAHLIGVREWLKAVVVPEPAPHGAAFATRVDIVRLLSGDAAVSIAKQLRARGVIDVERECFLVSSSSHLLEGERSRAEQWADGLPALASAGI